MEGMCSQRKETQHLNGSWPAQRDDSGAMPFSSSSMLEGHKLLSTDLCTAHHKLLWVKFKTLDRLALCRERTVAQTWWPGRRGGRSEDLPQRGQSLTFIIEAADRHQGLKHCHRLPCRVISQDPGHSPVTLWGNRVQNNGAPFWKRQSTLQCCLQQQNTWKPPRLWSANQLACVFTWILHY